jgi:cyclopropane-fatty-acyl-phospholipid synthase
MGSTQAQVEVSYDVGNEFFRLWLDESMFYTCAVFEREGQSLEAAQQNKMRILSEFAGVGEGTSVLDIGCGWGASLEYLSRATKAAKITGVTLSRAQAEEIRARNIARVHVDVADFMKWETTEKFSALISICMIDHLCSPEQAREGKAVDIFREYFKKCWEITEPGSKFGFQAILRGRVPRELQDLKDYHWVTHEIFPGGLNPRIEELAAAVNPYWEIVEVHTRRQDYRKTTAEWLARLRLHESVIRQKWGDQVFADYERYLSTCVTGFAKHYSSLIQIRLHRIDTPVR